MRRFLKELVAGRRSRADERRRRELDRAARERQRDASHGGSIWRTGKGGSHHDRM